MGHMPSYSSLVEVTNKTSDIQCLICESVSPGIRGLICDDDDGDDDDYDDNDDDEGISA